MTYTSLFPSTFPFPLSAAIFATTASIFLYGQLKAGYKNGLKSNLPNTISIARIKVVHKSEHTYYHPESTLQHDMRV